MGDCLLSSTIHLIRLGTMPTFSTVLLAERAFRQYNGMFSPEKPNMTPVADETVQSIRHAASQPQQHGGYGRRRNAYEWHSFRFSIHFSFERRASRSARLATYRAGILLN